MAAAILDPTASRLILTGGASIDVASARVEGTRVVFRRFGQAYSLPVAEVDIAATNSLAAEIAAAASRPREEPNRLRVSPEQRDRILKELETKRAERESPAKPSLSVTAPRKDPEPVLSPAEREAARREELAEERYWRAESRQHEEDVRRAEEELQLLRSRIQRLEDEILSLLSLGYQPREFTLQALQLERSRDALPRALLELERAERLRRQFREDARRAGVLPGWLR